MFFEKFAPFDLAESILKFITVYILIQSIDPEQFASNFPFSLRQAYSQTIHISRSEQVLTSLSSASNNMMFIY